MKKPLLLIAIAASLALAPAAQAQFIGPTGSGYNGALGYQYTTPQAATMSVMMQGMQQQAMSTSMLYQKLAMSEAMRGQIRVAQQQAARGQKLIKSGRATMRFSMRAWPNAFWLKHTAGNTGGASPAEERRILDGFLRAQRAYFARRVALEGAQWGDMADMMSIATVIAVEAHTGRRVSRAGFQKQRELFRRAWLRNPIYQGGAPSIKQELYESQLLLSTAAWYRREKQNDVTAGQKTAADFLDRWFGQTASVVSQYAPYLSA